MKKIILSLVLGLLGLSETIASDEKSFEWGNATVYFVITDRFYNGDTNNDVNYRRIVDHAMRLTPAWFFGFFLRSATKALCGYWAALFALVFALSSCSDDLDVQQSYPFTVEVMPYAGKIVKGQTVELRFEIQPEGNYTNTLHTIRYFQYDGEARSNSLTARYW